MRVFNQTRGQILVNDGKIAHTFFERLRGLIGSCPLHDGEGLLIPSCQGIHSFGMSFPIDVLYLDSSGLVISAMHSMRPNRFGKVLFSAASVLELPSGTLLRTGTAVGDHLHTRL